MISSFFLVPLLLTIGSGILWFRVRDIFALFMAMGFFMVLATTLYSMFGPPIFTLVSREIIQTADYSLVTRLLAWMSSGGGLSLPARLSHSRYAQSVVLYVHLNKGRQCAPFSRRTRVPRARCCKRYEAADRESYA